MPTESPQIRIRAMTRADLPAARDLLDQLGYKLAIEEVARRFAAVVSAPGHAAMVAEAAGRVAGLVHVYARPALENPPEAIVQALVVEDARRRGGVGRALMAAAEAWAIARGLRSLALSSNSARSGAHAFYHALGYRTAATSLILRKDLKAAK
jgi:GNAT superfamily N-acetyltransferase